MGWLTTLLGFLKNLFGFGEQVVKGKNEQRELNNTPEMKQNAERIREAAANDATQKTVEKAAGGDQKSLEELRKEIS